MMTDKAISDGSILFHSFFYLRPDIDIPVGPNNKRMAVVLGLGCYPGSMRSS